MKALAALSACLPCLLELSCTSVAGRAMKVSPPGIYQSVEADLVGFSGGHFPAWVVYPYCVIDLPFSAAFDTVLLPYDLWREHHDTNYWFEARTQMRTNSSVWPPNPFR
jgi:uncharacterized protein YceK